MALSMIWHILVPRLNVMSFLTSQTILRNQTIRTLKAAIPFSLRIRCPAMPPETTRRDEVLAYSGSRTTHLIGRRKSIDCDSRTWSPCTITFPTNQHSALRKHETIDRRGRQIFARLVHGQIADTGIVGSSSSQLVPFPIKQVNLAVM